jgi:hypothetical protein
MKKLSTQKRKKESPVPLSKKHPHKDWRKRENNDKLEKKIK